MSANCKILVPNESDAEQKAKAFLQAHPGKPISAFYTALMSGSDDAADVAVAIALDPLCGIDRSSERGERHIVRREDDFQLECQGGATPLLLAVNENKLSVAERLLKARADPNIAEYQFGYTALHLVKNVETAALLLRYGADQNTVDELGMLPFHSALHSKQSDVIPLLLENGSDVNARSQMNGATPLHVAASLGDMPSLTLLLSANADSSLLDKYGNTPLLLAVMNNQLEAVSCLASLPGAPLNAENVTGRTALNQACFDSRPKIIRVLLENNADFSVVELNTMDLPVHRGAVRRPHNYNLVLGTLLEFGWADCGAVLSYQNSSIESISMLLDAGCDVDETGRDGMKPLHFAAQRGCPKVISLLVAEGATLHAPDASGCTPLHYAASIKNDETLDNLISLGADVNAVNKEGQTPLHFAAQNMRVKTIDSLVRQGCNAHIKDNEGRSALDVFEAAIISPNLRSPFVDHVRHLLATITMTPKRSERSCVVS